VIAQKIVRLHHIDIVNLCRLLNLACAFRTRDVGARAHLTPAPKGPAYPKLRPNTDDQRHAEIKQKVTAAVSDWVEHSCFKCVC